MKPSSFSIVLVTAPNVRTARRIAKATLNAKLAACVNLVPGIESRFWWEGNLNSAAEVLMLFKTTNASLPKLERLILSQHPYETPEFVVLPISRGNRRYLSWISSVNNP